jgi:DNA-binding winged helix-turn-helix (wHTH) protein
MIFGILAEDNAGAFDIPKLVCSLWLPTPEGPGILNLSVVVRSLSNKPLSEFTLATTDQLSDIADISPTLLDRNNPISTVYSGQYEKADGNRLALYDGVPDVRVSTADLRELSRQDELFLYKINVGEIRPGESIGFRMLAQVRFGGSLDWNSKTVELNWRFFDTSAVMDRLGLSSKAIRLLVRYNMGNQDGGFDPFLYVPKSWNLVDTQPAVDRTLTRIFYDWLGRATSQPWIRYAWSPRQILEQQFVPSQDGYFFVPPRRVLISARLRPSQEEEPDYKPREWEHRGYAFGPFRLHTTERLLFNKDTRITLRPGVFDLLVILVERPKHLFTKDELMSALWPEDKVVEEGNLTERMSSLRRALGDSPKNPKYIETEPKKGYRFCADVKEL